MLEISTKARETKAGYFKFKLDGKVLSVPPVSAMSIADVMRARDLDSDDERGRFLYGLFAKHIGEDAMEKLTSAQFAELVEAWNAESLADGEAGLGES